MKSKVFRYAFFVRYLALVCLSLGGCSLKEEDQSQIGVVKFSDPGGKVGTVIQLDIKGHRLCQTLNSDVWNGIQASCGDCKKQSDSCSATLASEYKSVINNNPYRLPYASSGNTRVIFDGAPAALLKSQCETTANEFSKAPGGTGRCILPTS